jgi:hypothetical protein
MKADETTLHNGVRRVVLVSYISLYPQELVRAGECSSMLVMDSSLAAIAAVHVVQKSPEILGYPNLGPISTAVVKTPSGAVVVLW